MTGLDPRAGPSRLRQPSGKFSRRLRRNLSSHLARFSLIDSELLNPSRRATSSARRRRTAMLSGPYPFGCVRHPRGTTRPVASAAHSRWPGGRARWAGLPALARKALNLLADQRADTQKKIEALTADIRADAKANKAAQRLQTIPGTGPMTASALVCALPDIAG
ncbi:MAG: hypothetical protein ACK5PT_07410, partial [Cereibacter sp.]